MKVTAINPGNVYLSNPRKNQWGFTVVFHRNKQVSSSAYHDEADSAVAAKQKMREQVSFLRRKHGVVV